MQRSLPEELTVTSMLCAPKESTAPVSESSRRRTVEGVNELQAGRVSCDQLWMSITLRLFCKFGPKSAVNLCVIPRISIGSPYSLRFFVPFLEWPVLFLIVLSKSLGCGVSTFTDTAVIDRVLVRRSDSNELARAVQVQFVSSWLISRNWRHSYRVLAYSNE